MKANGTVMVSGQAMEATGRGTPSSTIDASFVATTDVTADIIAISVSTSAGSVGLSRPGGDTIDRGAEYRGRSADGGRAGVFGNPASRAWDYQTYGVWQTGIGGGSPRTGAGSFGAASPAGAIPISGDVVFTGQTAAVYTDVGGNDQQLIANVTLTVLFGQRTASLQAQNLGPSTRLTANLSYQAGENRLTGTATTGAISGPITARFYGPAASEVGGVYSLGPPSGSGSAERLIGAFGAKKLF